MTCTTLIKKLKKCMKMKFLKKKLSRGNTKILAKNAQWRVEIQLSRKFANIGKSAIE